MTKAEILPKTPRELRSKIQMMRRVLKLVYIDSEVYFGTLKECILVEINAFKKEKTDFFTAQPIFNPSSPGTLSNDFHW